jgi:site-specific recombinase XerD
MTVGTVQAIATRESATIIAAVDDYLATLAGPESAGTRRVYSGVLRALAGGLGADTEVPTLQPRPVAVWFVGRWGDRAPSTWNVALGAIRSAAEYWQRQGWIADDPTRLLQHRKLRPDRSRALPRADVERLLTRDDIALRPHGGRILFSLAAVGLPAWR